MTNQRHAHDLTCRELEAEVARQIFGLEVQEHRNTRSGEMDFVHGTAGGWLRVTEYATNLSANITLENELAKRGWRLGPLTDGTGPDI